MYGAFNRVYRVAQSPVSGIVIFLFYRDHRKYYDRQEDRRQGDRHRGDQRNHFDSRQDHQNQRYPEQSLDR